MVPVIIANKLPNVRYATMTEYISKDASTKDNIIINIR